LISAVEHHAVLHSAEYLRSRGMDVTVVPVDHEGRVDVDAAVQAMTPRTCLVSVMHANNEVGTVQPLGEIAEAARTRGILVHTDAVQSFGKVAVSAGELGVDLLSVSAHKLYGPKGIGALFIRKGTRVEPMFHGGGQESGRRPGTENVPLAAGFAAAVQLSTNDRDAEQARLRGLRDHLRSDLLRRFEGLVVNGSKTSSLSTILNVSFDSKARPLDGEALIMGLDLRGVAVTSGSACTSGSLQPSHVLLAMGRDVQTARATIRFSVGRGTTLAHVERAVEALEEVVREVERAKR
jgi:cysteine desulfurase